MRIRPKLSGAPLDYTMARVDGSAEPYKAFGQVIWTEDSAVAVTLKELVFLRTSIINQCPT